MIRFRIMLAYLENYIIIVYVSNLHTSDEKGTRYVYAQLYSLANAVIGVLGWLISILISFVGDWNCFFVIYI